MRFRNATIFFFCAAATAFPALLHAEDREIRNLRGSANIEIADGDALSVRQDIDGEYAGTLSGGGSLAKRGDAELTLNGEISLGTINVESGALTFGAEAALTREGYTTVFNSETGTVIIAFSDAQDTQLNISGINSEKIGSIVSTGNASVNRLVGDTLNVNAGTLIIRSEAGFNEIGVLGGALLQLGTGKTDSLPSLSGNVSLEKGATLVFSRAAISGESTGAFSYSGKISGEGDVIFNGSSPVYFTGGNDQTYTGTTTISAGGMIFQRATQTVNGSEYYDPEAKAATLASSSVGVEAGGQFGGHVTARGDVSVGGTAFSSVADWQNKIGENTWGAWHAGAGTLVATGGNTLTVCGDLKIAGTELEYYTVENEADAAFSDGRYYYNIRGNSGGAVRVEFSALGAGKIVAKGKTELGGTLILVGADGLEPGQTAVFFESDPNRTTGAFDQVVYGSDNVTLLLPGVGGIRDGQYGIAVTENRNLRKRASFEEHEGLSEFVDYLVSQADGMNKVAQAASLADADSVSDVVNNFSALPYCALAEMAMRQSDSELEMILLDIARARLKPPESQDGVRVPANFTFFSGLLTDFVDHESGDNTPVYDFDSIGAYAGGHAWLDDERMAGASLGLHRSSAKPHGNGGTLDDAAARARIFAVFAPKFSEWFLTIGGTLGVHHYSIDRKTALGENTGSTNGIDAGVFASINFRQAITRELFFTPYLRLEYNFCYVGGLDESGSDSRLKLKHMIFNNYRARVGSGFEYAASEGKTFGVDFGLVGTFGERPEITSEFAAYEGSRTRIKGTVGERVSGEIAPRFSIDFGDGWSAGAAYRLQCSFEGSLSHSFGVGLSRQF